MEAIFIVLVVVVIYFAPTFIAVQDKKTNKNAIIALNILAGWTVVGWIVALVWAMSKDASR